MNLIIGVKKSRMDNKKLVDYLLILVNKKWNIVLWTSVFAIISVVIALLLPKYWVSKTSFSIRDNDSIGSAIPDNITSMIGNSMLGSLTSSGDGQKLINIMSSRSFKEEVINEFELTNYFKIKEEDNLKALDIALLKLKKIVSVNLSEETGVISVRSETQDKQLSVDICNFYRVKSIEKLTAIDKEQKQSEYNFLNQRFIEYNKQYDDLLIQMKDFQKENNLISLNSQQQILLQAYSEMVATGMENDLELMIIEENYSKESPEYKRLLMEDEFLEKQIQDFESHKGLSNSKYVFGLSNIPSITEQYARLYIRTRILEKVTTSLYPMLEASRFEYLKEKEYISIIDYPRLAGMRSKPKRAKFVVIATFLSFIFVSIIVLVISSINAEDRAKWKQVWKQMLVLR